MPGNVNGRLSCLSDAKERMVSTLSDLKLIIISYLLASRIPIIFSYSIKHLKKDVQKSHYFHSPLVQHSCILIIILLKITRSAVSGNKICLCNCFLKRNVPVSQLSQQSSVLTGN